MRPVCRGASPQPDDFKPYDKAQPFLIGRLGGYCSYCERRIATQLAVEHIQPKGLDKYAHLIGRWENYLLSCVNCNSTKSNKDVMLKKILLPDRDNTYAAFSYLKDGYVVPSDAAKAAGLYEQAQDTLKLTGLDKRKLNALDENGKQVAIDRVSQRLEVWAVAEEAKSDVVANPDSQAVKRGVVRTAQASGFFSIWMTVFQGDAEMCNQLIDAFAGTRESACFDPVTAVLVSPAPNPDKLPNGGKI